MNTQTEMEIRAQAMITIMGQQRIEAMDALVYAKAEIAIRDAKIKELQDQLEAKTVSVNVEAAPIA